MGKRLTKGALQAAMNRIEREPNNDAALQAGADLLGVGFERDIDGGLLYRGAFYPDRDELVDEILCDLGNKRNGL